MNVWQVKLSTNEEILCEIVGNTEEDLKILNPLKIIEIPNFTSDETNAYYVLRPWFSFMGGFNEKELSLSCRNVLAKYQPSESVVKHYIESVADVIECVTKDIFTPEDFIEQIKEQMVRDSSSSNVITFPKF